MGDCLGRRLCKGNDVMTCVISGPLIETDEMEFGIGDLSQEFGISTRALRFYEEEELITPRRDGAARIYSRRDRARIAWIVRGKSVGFSLDEIRELLDLYDLADGRRTQKQTTVRRCRARAGELQQRVAELEAMIETLSDFADRVERENAPA